MPYDKISYGEVGLRALGEYFQEETGYEWLSVYETTMAPFLKQLSAEIGFKDDKQMRHTRYQGAIIKDDKILLLKHTEHESGRSYWVIPGGGREADETEMACVRREMREETNLEVMVERLLVESVIPDDHTCKKRKTYLCHVISGQASPGYEPEEDAAAVYAITEVAWFDLRSEDRWAASIFNNHFAYPVLQEIRRALGYV